MSKPTAEQLVSAYRSLYRGGLHAVQYAKPGRYILRDQLRLSFRNENPESFDQTKVDNTVNFLALAARERGLEHKILKNLLHMEWARQDGLKRPKIRRNPVQAHIHDTVTVHYHMTLAMLNDSMGLCLR